MINGNGRWTPTQQAIMNLLSDGNFHPVEELIACLPEAETGSVSCVRQHVSLIRKCLIGHDVFSRSVSNGSRKVTQYRLVRLIGSAHE